ncbi:MAG TPA: endonuclease III [Terriglobales bacterium]|nr:endonuclease III [Terriglobales bacterium]
MARGIVPRQPGKAGRQAGVQKPAPSAAKPARSMVITRTKNGPASPLSASQVEPRAPKPKPPAKSAATSQLGKSAKASSGYNSTAPDRITELVKRLDATYPGATCALHHKNAWELLVATILSAQCTDVRVNMVTPELFRKYPTPEAFAALNPEQLEPDIKSTGFFRNKAKSVVGAARKVVSEFGGNIPNDMDQLLSLPGVARKTANVVLGTWFGKAEGVVVDTHVHRISRRLELTTNDEPQKIEQDLMRVIPREHWISFAHQIILHGRALCIARKPKCADCPLENICHAADKTWSTVDIHKNAQP